MCEFWHLIVVVVNIVYIYENLIEINICFINKWMFLFCLVFVAAQSCVDLIFDIWVNCKKKKKKLLKIFVFNLLILIVFFFNILCLLKMTIFRRLICKNLYVRK